MITKTVVVEPEDPTLPLPSRSVDTIRSRLVTLLPNPSRRVKVKYTTCLIMRSVMGTLIPAYSQPRHYMEVSGQFHVPAALPLGEETAVFLEWQAG